MNKESKDKFGFSFEIVEVTKGHVKIDMNKYQ